MKKSDLLLLSIPIILILNFGNYLFAQSGFHKTESGKIIAYCYQPLQRGLHQIYVIDEDGNNNRKLIEASIGLNHHDWSPDAQQLAAVGYVNQSTWSIYKFNYDGTGLTRLTTTNDVLDSEPSWSPDGNEIAFTRVYPDQNYKNEIWLMNADGSNQHYIGVDGFAAKWSADGAKFIFTNAVEWNGTGLLGSDINICDTNGTNLQQITHTEGDEWFPSWSPDGSQILFGYSSDGNYASHEIYKMNSDTTGRQQLTVNNSYDGSPRWSPDGSRICYSSDISSYQQWEIYIMDNNGTNIKRVTNSPTDVTAINPAWMPIDSTSSIEEISISPESLLLYQNYPNPFNPTTNIIYQIPERSYVTMRVYDVLGNGIATLVNEEKPAGKYEAEFTATGLSNGIYYYHIVSNGIAQTKKMLLLK